MNIQEHIALHGQPFSQKSEMIIPYDDEQRQTLVKFRDSLDYIVINNISTEKIKAHLFEHSREITRFINQQ